MNSKKLKSTIHLIVVSLILAFISGIYQDKGNDHNAISVLDSDYLLEVHYIDVGQGDSIFIRDAVRGTTVLIDGGDGEYGEEVVKFLKEKNVDALDYVVATHPHSDHIGGLITVMNSFPVEVVIMPEISHTTKTYEDFLNSILLNETGTSVIYAENGMKTLIGDLKAELYAPFNNTEDLNNNSVVIRMDYHEYSFLFTGDMEKVVEKEILDMGYDVNVDFLKVAHHGSNTSSLEAFIEEVTPLISVIQVGEDNKYGHPHQETMDLLNKIQTKIYRNDEQGTVSIYIAEDGYFIETAR